MENLPAIFWLSVFLGAALVLIAYLVYQKVRFGNQEEGFQSAGAAVVPSPPPAIGSNVYVETRSQIPQGNELVFYLTSFSSDAEGAAPGTTPLYSAPQNRWRNWSTVPGATDYDFTLSPKSGMMPAAIYPTGLPTKNISMYGPSSQKLAAGGFPYTLGAFTVVLFGKIGSLVFDTQAPVVLWKVYLETPDAVQLSIYPIAGDTRNVYVRLQLGPANQMYEWNIPAATLLGNGVATTYSLVYEPTSRSAVFYIGTLRYTANLGSGAANRLGNTQVEINSDGRLDMNLSAVLYYKKALSDADVEALQAYLTKQLSGLPAALQRQEQKASLQVSELQLQVTRSSNVALDLANELQKCRTAAAAAASNLAARGVAPTPDASLQWQIRAPTGEPTGFIDAETLKKCTPLLIQPYGNTGNVPPKTPAAAKGPQAVPYPAEQARVGGDSVLWSQLRGWFA